MLFCSADLQYNDFKTHTHTHAHTHARTHAHTHTRTHARTQHTTIHHYNAHPQTGTTYTGADPGGVQGSTEPHKFRKCPTGNHNTLLCMYSYIIITTVRPRLSAPLLSGSLAIRKKFVGYRFTACAMHTYSMCVRLSGSLACPDVFLWKTDVCGNARSDCTDSTCGQHAVSSFVDSSAQRRGNEAEPDSNEK